MFHLYTQSRIFSLVRLTTIHIFIHAIKPGKQLAADKRRLTAVWVSDLHYYFTQTQQFELTKSSGWKVKCLTENLSV